MSAKTQNAASYKGRTRSYYQGCLPRPRRGNAHARRLVLESLEPRLVLDSVVVFNEIMYNPAGDQQSLEWVELYNQMGIDVDVSKWSLADGIRYSFPAGTVIPASGYLVVAADPAQLQAQTGYASALGPYSGQLSNAGDKIELRNNSDRVMDSVNYGDSGKWPVSADGSGASLAKIDPDAASAPADNWRGSQQAGGTPGSPNFPAGVLLGPPTTLLSIDANWWYDDTGTDRGDAWRDPAYSPSAAGWKQAGALFYDTVATLPAPKTTALASGRNTYYFRTSFSFDGNPNSTQLTLNAIMDDGAVFYLNGAELQRVNMPTGAISYSTNALAPVGNAAYSQPIVLSGNGLTVGHNVLAVELHQAATTGLPGLTLLESGGDNGSGGVPDNLALQSRGSTAFAKDLLPGYPDRRTIPHLNDGQYGNSYSWIGNSSPTFAGIAFSGAKTISKIAWGRDNTGGYTDRNQGTYTVQYTTAASPNAATPDASWTTIGSVTYTGSYPDNTPARRHLWGFPSLSNVTGVRIVVSSGATCIDELEVYPPDAPDAAFGAALVSAPIREPPPALHFNEVPAAGSNGFWVELANYGATSLQLDGCVITSSAGARCVLPAGSLAPGQFLSVPAAQLGFGAADGDKLFLYSSGMSMVLDGVQVNTTLRGRWPDGNGPWLSPVAATPGEANNFQLRTEVVINEIMYNHRLLAPAQAGAPPRESPEQWIELHNRSDDTVDLSGWRIAGGASYTFPAGTALAADDYLVVSNDAAALTAKYPAVHIIGNLSGSLSRQDDEVRLLDQAGNTADEVHYYDGSPWPAYADQGGSSLELRDPSADNAAAGAWAASDESTRSTWQTYTYRGTCQASAVGPDGNLQEFVLGLLDAGEVWLDDVSVVENPAGTPVQRVRNGNFESGAANWQLLGNHAHSQVIVDPADAGNHVLRLVSTGSANHLSDHVANTLSGTITNGVTYEISYKAKWINGSNQLNSRLYFSRLAKTTLLAQPDLSGTPGSANSRRVTNLGPTYTQFQHSPVTPGAGQSVTVSVLAADPDGVTGMTLYYSAAGAAWASASMTSQGGGLYSAAIPGFAASTIVQFYVTGRDNLGATSMYPAAGANSRALYQVDDGVDGISGLHSLRVIMTSADVARWNDWYTMEGNDAIGCTVVYDGHVYYDVGVRLKGSPVGRPGNARGFHIDFHADDLFRGVQASVGLDRSGRRYGGVYGQDEIVAWHVLNTAGNIPSMYDDLVNLVAPTVSPGLTLLQLDKYGDGFLDSQYPDGSAGSEFIWELIYYGQSGAFKQAWLTQDLGADKEQYRWVYWVDNNAPLDDYSRMIAMAQTFTRADFAQKAAGVLDVEEWLRYYAAMTLIIPSGDHYFPNGLAHNAGFYFRADTGKAVILPYDMDLRDFPPGSEQAALPVNADLQRLMTVPAYWRGFYGNLQDILTTTYNTGYMSPWVTYYNSLLSQNGQNIADIAAWIANRASFARTQLAATCPQVVYAITTNGGQNFSVNDTKATLTGTAWINAHEIRLNGSSQGLPLTWTGNSTWQATVPLVPGANPLVLRAYDYQGQVVGTDSITVTSTVAPTPLQQYLRITELNYSPTAPTDAEQALNFTDNDDFEFIELTNTSTAATLDLHGVKLSAGVVFDFTASGSILSLAARDRILLVRSQAAFEARYGTGLTPKIAGVYTGKLDNSGEEIALSDGGNTSLLDFTYGVNGSWPGRANGQGSSLEMVNTGGDYNDPNNWQSSLDYNGSPGAAGSAADVVVNEVLAHSDHPLVDAIELYNTTGAAIDVSGWWLSDTSEDYFKFQIPAGTIIAAHAYLVLNEGHWAGSQLEFADNEFGGGPKGFGLNSGHGDDVWLVQAEVSRNVKRFADHVQFGATTNGESYGRWQDDQGRCHFYPMVQPTLETPANANTTGGNGPRVGRLLISEVMYAPAALKASETAAGFAHAQDMQFIEIYNPTAADVTLTNWHLSDAAAFDFPAGTVLRAGKTLVVVPFDPANAAMLAAFRARYANTTATVIGPCQGHLSGSGDKVQLLSPDVPPLDEPTWYPPLLEDELLCSSSWAGGSSDGKSLQRVAADGWGPDQASWATAAASPGVVHLVAGQYVVYNNSAFDGPTPAADVHDDNAIASDKKPLLPGRLATFDNYTSYARGLNAIIVDLAGAGATFTSADFRFLVGNDNSDPSAWPLLTTAASFSARVGAGVGGSTRVEMTWPDNAIQNQWLRVEVLSTANTGLGAPDVFYFGNAIAETGNHRTDPGGDTTVDASDEAAVRSANTALPAPIEDPYDFNRDRRVNATDELIARSNFRAGDDRLMLLDVTRASQSIASPAGTSLAAALRTTTPASTPLQRAAVPRAAPVPQVSVAEAPPRAECLPASIGVHRTADGMRVRAEPASRSQAWLAGADWTCRWEMGRKKLDKRESLCEAAVDRNPGVVAPALMEAAAALSAHAMAVTAETGATALPAVSPASAQDVVLQAASQESFADQLAWLWQAERSQFTYRSKKDLGAVSSAVDQLLALMWL